MLRRVILLGLILVLLLGLPLLGVTVAGKPLEPYLEFPPVTQVLQHPSFSWPAFAGVVLFVAAVVLPFVVMILVAPKPPHLYLVEARALPWWGWAGVGLMVVAWIFAWTRFPWFESLQSFTFTPLWLGYILAVNALTLRRTGHCMLLDRIGYFLSLFLLSAAFWWFFEYLNRFVQNWYYVGGSELGAIEYFWQATLPFSTVLPAVLGTIEYLESFPRLDEAFRDLWPVQVSQKKPLAWAVLLIASAGLTGIAIWPQYLFPLVWMAPLLIITSLQVLAGEETVFSTLVDGDWRPIWLPAMAGLICGFFWELWNSGSFAHWEYDIPYVDRFQLFEMPLLGYAGYLPFGLECVVIAALLPGGRLKIGGSA